jgi:anhydro-N-acetylmuramic acid kinase
MPESGKEYKAIGVMSGTSLDGVDLVACSFKQNNEKWDYRIYHGTTCEYPTQMFNRLLNSHQITGLELAVLNKDYGRFLGVLVSDFMRETRFVPDFIASHGYTVFHEPVTGLTLQIGSGAEIAATTGIKTVCDFRTTDVALGGNGAPLVPIGDKLLFSEYTACLNLGGFSNISFDQDGHRIALDVCPVNIVLNHLMRQLGKAYDDKGQHGQKGNVNQNLLDQLNDIPYYKLSAPKSLGREFVEDKILPVLNLEPNIYNVLATFYQHIALQISQVINEVPKGKILVTGGGAYNHFLVELIQNKTESELVIPQKELIDLKEALIFAFLGMLRVTENVNCLQSVTGSSKDNIGGAVYLG